MNLALEYILRDDKIRNLLSFPSSLFVNKENGNKLIITIYTSDYDLLKVIHWDLQEINNKIPIKREFNINIEDVFTNNYICLKDCYLLEYEDEPYQVGGSQSTDLITGAQQQIEYDKPLLNLYNSNIHRRNRFKWLWKAFALHLPKELLEHPLANDDDMLRELMQHNFKGFWFAWNKWMKLFLENKKVSSELVFKSCFPENKKIWTYYTAFTSF